MPVAASRRRPPPKPAPQADPRFRKVVENLKQGAAKVKAHPPGKKKAIEASAAAKGPPDEKLAAGKAQQVDKIQEAPAKKPETDSFLALLRAEIQKAMPQTLGDAEQFMKGGQGEQIKGSLKGNVNQKKDEAAGGVKSASKEAPKEAGAAKPVTPIPPEAAPGAPAVNGAEGMPAPKPDADVSLEDSKQDADALLKEKQITPEQLKKANDPRFSSVLTAKDAVGKQADAGPAKYRAGEKGVLSVAAGQAQAEGRRGAAAVVGVRGRSNSAVLSKQAQAKAQEEKDRAEVTKNIGDIFTATKTSVEAKLAKLETDVGAMFDVGVDLALKTMKDYVDDKIFKFKLERYLGSPIGLALLAKDELLGPAPEVNAILERGRTLFTGLMDALVVRVAAVVEQALKDAKNEVAKGQASIKKYVAGLDPKLRTFGEGVAKEVSGKFQELESGIEDKKNQIAQQLAEKYKDASDKANAALKAVQDENKGLVDVLAEKVGEVWKILTEFKDKLMAILKKGEDTIKLILDDPIGFLGNLIAAIKLGFNQFVANIKTHLIKGFFAWLFGALAEAGIEIPDGLPSLPSILKLVLSVLGITYDRMRAKAVKLIGERAVSVIETLVKYVKALIDGGPAKLWEQIKSDLSDLKDMVIGAIQDYIITTVVQRAIAKLVTLFNPVGAIVQAVLAIYDTVTFLIEKASQIMALIEAVVNSVNAIATGAIGGAANWIEQALARTIPVVIGFLAQFVGLGKISKKIKEFIQKVQARVDKAIDAVIAKVVATVKKLVGKLTGKDKDKDKDKDKEKDKEDEGQGDDVDPALLEPLKKVEVSFSLGRSSHKLILDPEAQGALKMASVAEPIQQKYAAAHAVLDNWKRYLASIQDQQVRNKYEKHWKAEIDAIVEIQTGGYQALYDRYYDEFAKKVAQSSKGKKPAKPKKGTVPPQPRKPSTPPPPQAPAQKFVKEATKEIQALVDRIRRWVLLQKSGDLTPDSIDKIIAADGEKIWKEEWEDRKKKVEAILKRHSKAVPGGGPILYTGSLAKGERGPHKGRIRFNPDAFDVDAYIVSREVHANALEAGGRTTAPRETAKILASSVVGGGPEGSLRAVVMAIRADLASVEGANAAKFDIHIRRNPL